MIGLFIMVLGKVAVFTYLELFYPRTVDVGPLESPKACSYGYY